MKPNQQHFFASRSLAKAAGTTLLEVLIAIVIFIVGMMALAHLQSNLTKSGSDANMRTVASNIAEEIMEDKRNFQKITSEAGFKAYDDIVSENLTVSRGGVDYNVVTTVQAYTFDPSDNVSVSKVANNVPSDFKHLKIVVTWGAGQSFEVDGIQTPVDLGDKTFEAFTVIPRVLDLVDAKVAAEDDGALGYPPVDYTPGDAPDIVAITVGTDKFKESTTPDPVVRRTDEFVETWFDVITYSTNALDDSVYLRREEFASVSCECELQAATDDAGLQPTVWNGVEYTEGALVNKQYGTEASNQQSQYCDVCCRDHHDTSRGPGSYRPWTSSANGNHKHYTRSNQGVLTEASVGDNYYEACRLIRKDGFFRVAQDFNLQSQTVFPENYLDDGSEVSDYSDEVRTAATNHFVDGDAFPDFTSLGYEGSDTDTRSNLPTAANSNSQQLRSRGIYADEVSTELADNLKYCFGIGGTVDDDLCKAKAAQSAMEIYPFFDVQLTKLSRWTTTQPTLPITVTNEEVKTNNTHSRGVATLVPTKSGASVAHSDIETGNVGLISILPITEDPASVDSMADIYLTALGDDTEPPPSGNPTISGTLSFAGGTSDPADATVTGSQDVSCTKPTNASFICIIGDLAVAPYTITIGNFWKNAANPLIACAPGLTLIEHHAGTGPDDNYTIYELPSTSTSGVAITVIKGGQGSC